MRVKIANTIDQFIVEYDNYLMENEAANQLLTFNVYSNKEKFFTKENIFGSIIENEKPVLIFINSYPFNLQVCGIKNSIQANDLLVNYLIENDIKINGVSGNKEDVVFFTNSYQRLTARSFKPFLLMDIMTVSQVNKINSLEKGVFQKADITEVDLILRYFLDFIKEAIGETFDSEKTRTDVLRRIEKGLQFVYKVDERIVSISHAGKRTKNSMTVSGVYTIPTERGKGYCTWMMYHLSKKYLDEGQKFVSLFVDKTNPISNKVYKKVGYRIVSENFDYHLQ